MSELGFEDLEQILGGYFHQDWMDEFSSEKEAIEYILKNESRRKIVSAKEAIEEVLNKDMSEEEYKDKLFALGNEYEYEFDGYSSREWLEFLLVSFERSVDRFSSSRAIRLPGKSTATICPLPCIACAMS